MRRINTNDLMPGMITAEIVKTKSGQIIIGEGIKLDNRLIDRLDFYGIGDVLIDTSEEDKKKKEEEEQQRIIEALQKEQEENERQQQLKIQEELERQEQERLRELEEQEKAERLRMAEEKEKERNKFLEIGNASYSQKIIRSDRFKDFQVAYSRNVCALKDAIDDFIATKTIAPRTLLLTTTEVLNEQRLTTIEMFDMLHNMRSNNDSIYAHSLNVSYIARVLGKWMKMDKEEVDELSIAGLFHDIGKTMIPKSILEKPGKLSESEFNMVKMHAQFGYDMLKDSGLSDRILNAILCHHERCDGTGYPNHLKTDKMDDFTIVLAVADVYDAMTAARPYREPLCPFEAISNFEKEGLQKYRPSVIMTFMERIANTYQNNRVGLSDGSKGKIVLLNNSKLSRPIVRLDDGTFIDLSSRLDLSIDRIL